MTLFIATGRLKLNYAIAKILHFSLILQDQSKNHLPISDPSGLEFRY